ncbi:MAG: tetratricopeptide repeat protein [Verrucomicrobiae bacterium]|nr:tetratricopeptide repeat protein [Verrucomicrobiae bacterium]
MKSPLPLLPFALLALAATLAGCSDRQRLERHLNAADQHFQKREFERAKLEYMNVVRLDRTNALAYLRLGKILFEQAQPQQAYPLLAWARRSFPEDLEVRSHLVAILTPPPQITNRTRFLSEVQDLLALSPTNETAVLALAQAAWSPPDIAHAEQTLADLRTRAGNHPLFAVAQAELERRRGDAEASEALLRQALQSDPQSPVAQLAYGNFLVLNRRGAEAEPHFRTAKDLTPPYAPAWERWARYLLAAGRTEEARSVLAEINAKAPERVHALILSAQVAIGDRRFEDAERALARALGQSPVDLTGLRVLAQLRLAQQRPDQAIRELEKVVAAAPNSEQAHYQMALAHLANRDPQRAAAALERALQIRPNFTAATLLLADLDISRGNSQAALTALRDSVRRNPDYEPAHLQLVRALRSANRLDDAETAARAARDRFPQNPRLALEHGLILRAQAKPEPARQAFEQALRLNPDDLASVEQLVQLDALAGDFPRALARVQERIDLNPNQVLMWLVKAEVHLAQGQAPLAESTLRRALQIDPDNELAFMSLARLYIQTGRQPEAASELEQLLRRDPNHIQALTMKGMLATERGDFPAARDAYQRVLDQRPNSVVALNNSAFLLAEHFNDLEGGYQLALRARDLAREDPLIADTLGWIEYRRGRYPDALRLLTEAAARAPDLPEIQYHLGMAHYMMGQEEPARVALRKAADAPAPFPGQEIARQHLALLDWDPARVDASTIAALIQRRQEAPRDLLTLSRLASAYQTVGDLPKAAEAVQAALAVNPQSVPLLTQAIRILSRHNDPAAALELARRARGIAPADPEVAHLLGRLEFLQGDQPRAFALLQESANRLPGRPDILHDLAWANFSQGRLDDAARSMQSAAAASPPDPARQASATTFLAVLNLARNPDALTQAADPQIQQALQQDAAHGPALFAQALRAAQQGRFDEARTTHERLLRRFPAFSPSMREMAILHAQPPSDDAKAFEWGVRAREAFPRDDTLAAALGKVVARRGDHRYAVQLLSQAAPTHPQDAELFYHLGLAHLGLRDTPQARAALERALTLSPSAPFANDARQRLAALPPQ